MDNPSARKSSFADSRRFLLLVWGDDGWANDGPDEGRGCLFKSEKAALAWARKTHPQDDPDGFLVIELPEFQGPWISIGEVVAVAGMPLVPYSVIERTQESATIKTQSHPIWGVHTDTISRKLEGNMCAGGGWKRAPEIEVEEEERGVQA